MHAKTIIQHNQYRLINSQTNYIQYKLVPFSESKIYSTSEQQKYHHLFSSSTFLHPTFFLPSPFLSPVAGWEYELPDWQ